MTQWALKRMAMVVVVLLWATWCPAREADKNSEHLRTYELDIFGPSAQAAVKQAAMHAVRSVIGEFYCSDEMMLARTLLERYVERYYEKFVVGQTILSRRESQGMSYLRVRIIVDARALENDLREKKFFYKPRRRPIIYVTVEETVDSAPVSGEPISRGAIHEGLKELLMDFEPRVIHHQAAHTNLTKDPQRLEATRIAATTAGVEVILTGRVDVTLAREKKIHFDDYIFYDARTTLTLIRVDDGLTLGTGTFEAGAGGSDKEATKRAAVSRATTKVLQDSIPKFAERWERTMTDNAEFQVMVVGVNPAEADVVEERLATRMPEAEVYRRSLFEDVAVFNLYYPTAKPQPGERERIEQVLRDLETPRFKIVPAKSEKHVWARRVP